MKKNRLFMMGTLAVLLAFGLVLAGCDSGDPISPDNGGGTLEVKIADHFTDDAMTAVTVPSGANIGNLWATLRLSYKDEDGTWRAVPGTWSVKWYKNDKEITGIIQHLSTTLTLYADIPQGMDSSFTPAYGYVKVEDGDEIKATVTTSNGETGTTGVVTVTVEE
jgi:hypothetical protein